MGDNKGKGVALGFGVGVGCEVFRASLFGKALEEVLSEQISEGAITPEDALEMLKNFDKAMSKKNRSPDQTIKSGRGKLKAEVITYNHADDVWTGELKDVRIVMDRNETKILKRMKFVACDSSIYNPGRSDNDDDGSTAEVEK